MIIRAVLAAFMALAMGSVFGDNFRVPMPSAGPTIHFDGYILIYQEVNARTGAIRNWSRVPDSPVYTKGQDCDKDQAGRLSKTGKDGYVRIYLCKALYHIVFPKGTEVL